jgi:hypothetical protein
MKRSAAYSQLTPGGIFAVREIADHPNDVFWVDSATGTDAAGHGSHPDDPVATIDYAIGLCTAAKGDVIYVMPGHNEGLGNAQIDVDVEGVSIIGLGKGSLIPRIDFDHANASIDIGANGCTLKNLRLLPSITDVLIGIDIASNVTDTTIDGIETMPGEDGAGADEFVTHIALKGGNSRTVIQGVKLMDQASAAGSKNGVLLDDACDDVVIRNFRIKLEGAALVAGINGDTTLSTNVLIEDGTITMDAEPGIEVLTGTTGIIRDVDIFTDLATIDAATVADGMAHFNVRYCEVGNEAGTLVKTESVDD